MDIVQLRCEEPNLFSKSSTTAADCTLPTFDQEISFSWTPETSEPEDHLGNSTIPEWAHSEFRPKSPPTRIDWTFPAAWMSITFNQSAC